jgi:hypothetical protein
MLAMLGLIVALVTAVAGHQQVIDHTGIFGAMIDHYFGAIIGLLQSGLLWLATKASPRWRVTAEPIKWGVLYLLGVLLTFISLKTGFGSQPVEGNALTLAAVLASVPTLASGLIFKIGGHKVPLPAATASARHV